MYNRTSTYNRNLRVIAINLRFSFRRFEYLKKYDYVTKGITCYLNQVTRIGSLRNYYLPKKVGFFPTELGMYLIMFVI